ncbi:MAG: substrate-binding domain-containing protein [Bacteroidia bacterium]|nr:substrate-binding domain-containing protein [Bacteroidia bacterium]
MKTLHFLSLALISATLTLQVSCSNNTTETTDKNKLSGNISISGAFALYPMVVKWAEEFQKLNPDVRIDVSAGGAGKGMTDVLQDMVDVAMISREIKEEEIQKGAWFIAVTKDAVLPVINSSNPVLAEIQKNGITKSQLSTLFTEGKKTTWGKLYNTKDKSNINVFNRSDACGAGEMWAKFFGKKQEDLAGTGVFGDPGIAEAVKNDVNGIGYNNVIYAYDLKSRVLYPGLAIIPIDLNENGVLDPEENFYQNLDSITNAIRTNRYPSPPARELFMVTKGKTFNPIVLAFYNWILTDGQKFIDEGGYVKLTDENIKSQIEKLK